MAFKKRTSTATIVALLLASTLTLASNVQPAKTLSTTVIVPDDFSTIQEAINNAADGDTVFVKAGTYYEHVVVNKTVSLVGEDVSTTIIDGNSTGHVIYVVSDNVSISGFTVQRSGNVHMPTLDAGICLNNTANCDISENRLMDNGFAGISLLYSHQSTIIHNNLSSTGWGGIHLASSSRNIVSGNIITDKYGGVNGHVSSNYNSITENTISNCTYGAFWHAASHNNFYRNNMSAIEREGIWLQDQVSHNTVAENIFINNTVALRVQGPNTNNTLSRNVITGAEYGIRIQSSATYTRVIDNIIVNNRAGNDSWSAGIRLDSGGYTQIHSNIITDNNYGILLYSSSARVSVFGNNISSNEFGLRIASGGSSYLNVSNNIIINNRGYGVGLTGFGGASNYATISRNLVVNNSDGIALGQYSNYHTICQNNISDNGRGFYIEYSTQNTIWGNSILDNDQQVHISTVSVNNWDNGYPSGGNYWSDYNGTDLSSGLYQNETGSDGIGDTTCVIDANNIDRYPLKGMFLDHEATSECHVQTICNSTLSDFQFNGTAIRFNVSGESGTAGFCRVCIPPALMNQTYYVFVNGTETLFNLLTCSNATHSYLYFDYTHSVQEVVIVPELTSFLIPLLSITAMLAAVIVSIRKPPVISKRR